MKYRLLEEQDTRKAILDSIKWCVSRAEYTHDQYKNYSLKDLFEVAKSVKYQTDKGNEQLIRSPRTLVKNGLGDCKSKTLFIVSHAILQGYEDIQIVWTNEDFSSYPKHVFCVIDGIVLDSVYGVYNAYPPHVKKWIDKINVKAMYNYRVEGVSKYRHGGISQNRGIEGTGDLYLMLRDQIVKDWIYLRDRGELTVEMQKKLMEAMLKVSLGYAKATNKTMVGTALQKVARAVKKLNPLIALGRNAYLGLLAINYRGHATKIYAIDRYGDKGKLKNAWEKFGGSYSKFIGAVNRGKDKKPLFGSRGVGEVVTATAATVTTASPILGVFAPLITALMSGLTVAGENWLKKKASELGGEKDVQTTNNNTPNTPNTPIDNNNNNGGGFLGGGDNTLVYIGLFAGAVYFFTKK